MRTRHLFLAGLLIVGTACSDNGTDESTIDTGPGGDSSDRGAKVEGLSRVARRLAPFDGCDTLLSYFQDAARERVGAYGLDGNGGYWFEGDVALPVDSVTAATDAPAAAESGDLVDAPLPATGGDFASDDAAEVSAGDGSSDYTTTNVQEVGVDEPDIVKTDGDRIVVISEGKLSLAVLDGEPRITDDISLPEGWNHELFLAGDRAFVLTNAGAWGQPMPVEPLNVTDDVAETSIVENSGTPAALLMEIDLSDPEALRITASLRIEGQYLSARTIGDTLRLAVSSGPDQLPWLYPSGPASEQRAIEANRATIDDSTLDDWLPSFRLTTDDSAVSGNILDCERTNRPAEFAGFDVISVVDVDLGSGLRTGFDTADAVGVIAGGNTVYSSLDRFYVATTTWTPTSITTVDGFEQWSDSYYTDLHAFAIGADQPTTYVGSGAVEGSLLNQFSLDEHEGYLRVITTAGSPWGGGDESQTQLVVLDEVDDELVEVGKVEGLGKGEQLFAARILDDVGFAVTFRQVDPFYVIDLTDPTNPRLAGELKIPGFSTYLHPISADRVLGIGQGTDEIGNGGTKLSLFDVSDPSNPREVANHVIPQTNSPAEYDHRAFQMIGTTAILPIQSWGGSFNGALLFDVGGDEIVELGRVTHTVTDQSPSGCEAIRFEDVPEASELYWRLADGYTTIDVCSPDSPTKDPSQYCEVLRGEDITWWFYDTETAATSMAQLGIDPEDRIDICYLQSDWRQQIQRSLVIDGTLWTVSQLSLQANDLQTLQVTERLPLAG